MTSCIETDVETSSVFQIAFLEACEHRWVESEKCGFDLGEAVLDDWYERFWASFVRHRHVEHLLGEVYWEEFPGRSFAIFQPVLSDEDILGEEFIDLYRQGWENLDFYTRACQVEWDLERVYDLLILINMNNARLNPQIPTEDSQDADQ